MSSKSGNLIWNKLFPVGLAGLLAVLALLLPVGRLAQALNVHSGTPFDEALDSARILRLALFVGALLLLVHAFAQRWFAARGLPSQATGLALGPDGWERGRPLPNWRLLGAILILSAFLRFVALDRDLWLDEIATLVEYARLPAYQTITVFVSANQHLLYSVLSSLSLSFFGESAWAVRLPAVLFGIGGVAALYYFARLLTSEREALWATLLLAVSYHHIWFSQNARGWIGLVFFTLLGSGLYLRALGQNRPRTWLAYVLVMTLGIFTHLNTLFILLGHFAAYVFVWRRWPGWQARHWPFTRRFLWAGLTTGALSFALYSFILPGMILYFQTTDRQGVGWTNPLELLDQVVSGLLFGFLGVGLLVLGIITLAGLLSYWRQSLPLVGLLVFPALFNTAVLVLLRVGAYPRAFLYLLPLGLMIAVRGAFVLASWLADFIIDRRPAGSLGQWIGARGAPSLLGLLVLASLVSLIPYYRTPKQNYTGALAYVDEHRQPEDSVAAVGLAASSYRTLYAPNLAFPETTLDVQNLRRENHTTWVIYTFQRDLRLRNSSLYDYLESEFTLVASFPGTVGDGTVWVVHDSRD